MSTTERIIAPKAFRSRWGWSSVHGDGAVDLLAERPNERVAIEIETGKSDIEKNLAKVQTAGFTRVVLVAASPAAATACQRAIERAGHGQGPEVELMCWLDVS